MKLWEVTNGYVGDSYVRALVIAATAEEAVEVAKPAFKADAFDQPYPEYPQMVGKFRYPPAHYEDNQGRGAVRRPDVSVGG